MLQVPGSGTTLTLLHRQYRTHIIKLCSSSPCCWSSSASLELTVWDNQRFSSFYSPGMDFRGLFRFGDLAMPRSFDGLADSLEVAKLSPLAAPFRPGRDLMG